MKTASLPATRCPPLPTRRLEGFTLVEVLVALAVVAIALLAGQQALGALLLYGQRQSDMLLGQICAENQLIALRLAAAVPPTGDSEVACPQAGRDIRVRISVMPTPNINFRRVDAQALEGDTPLLRISTVVGEV